MNRGIQIIVIKYTKICVCFKMTYCTLRVPYLAVLSTSRCAVLHPYRKFSIFLCLYSALLVLMEKMYFILFSILNFNKTNFYTQLCVVFGALESGWFMDFEGNGILKIHGCLSVSVLRELHRMKFIPKLLRILERKL